MRLSEDLLRMLLELTGLIGHCFGLLEIPPICLAGASYQTRINIESDSQPNTHLEIQCLIPYLTLSMPNYVGYRSEMIRKFPLRSRFAACLSKQ